VLPSLGFHISCQERDNRGILGKKPCEVKGQTIYPFLYRTSSKKGGGNRAAKVVGHYLLRGRGQVGKPFPLAGGMQIALSGRRQKIFRSDHPREGREKARHSSYFADCLPLLKGRETLRSRKRSSLSATKESSLGGEGNETYKIIDGEKIRRPFHRPRGGKGSCLDAYKKKNVNIVSLRPSEREIVNKRDSFLRLLLCAGKALPFG